MYKLTIKKPGAIYMLPLVLIFACFWNIQAQTSEYNLRSLGSDEASNTTSVLNSDIIIEDVQLRAVTSKFGEMKIDIIDQNPKPSLYKVAFEYYYSTNIQVVEGLSAINGQIIMKDAPYGDYLGVRVIREDDLKPSNKFMVSEELLNTLYKKSYKQNLRMNTCSGSVAGCDNTTHSYSNLPSGDFYNIEKSDSPCGFKLNADCSISDESTWMCVEPGRSNPEMFTQYAEVHYSEVGMNELEASRVNWIICNYPSDYFQVQHAIWDAAHTNVSSNTIYLASVAAIPTPDGTADYMTFYKAIDSINIYVQHMVKYECVTPNIDISGNVYNDTNGNVNVDGVGINNPSSTPLFATLIDDAGNIVASVPVNSDGSYMFSDVTPNSTYTVQLGTVDESGNIGSPPGSPNLPSGWVNTGEDCCDGSGTDGNTNGILTVTVGTEDVDMVDFGIVEGGSISGNVSEDTNNDNEGEVNLNNITIDLYLDTNNDGVADAGELVASVTTDASGNYLFENLPVGNYLVVENESATGVLSLPDSDYVDVLDGDSDTTDPLDNEANNSSTTDDMIPVILASGENDIGNDFIEKRLGAISGSVTMDTDNNGSGDTAQGNVTVTLTEDTNGNGMVDAGEPQTSIQTNPDGTYEFTGLEPGDYIVTTTDPTGSTSIKDQDEETDGDAGDSNVLVDNTIAVTVNPGEEDKMNNFIDAQLGSISGFVTEDTDDDGEGNVAITGVTINLIGPGPDGDISTTGDNVIVQTTMTSTNFLMPGFYEFTDLTPGDYIVMEVQPANLINVKDGDEDDSDPLDNEINNASTTDDLIPVNLALGENDISNNFVEKQSLASISGVVTEDLDNDDVGDDPLIGVTITLLDDNNVTVGTTTTSDGTTDLDGDGTNEPAGSYYFGGLQPGDYTVVETDPSGDYRSVVDGDSTTPGDDTVNSDTNDNMIPVSVNAGESDTGNDFVDELIPGTISGFVAQDTNDDGEGDMAIGGVTINLIGPGPDGDISTTGDNVVVQSTTTSSDFTMPGFYEFTDVSPGDYLVMEVQPDNMINVKDGDEDDSDPLDTEVNNGSTTDDLIPVNLAAGENDIRNDFVEEASASISGVVTEDLNNDDIGDDPLIGVTITLLDENNVTVGTTTTSDGTTDLDGDGTNEPAGSYYFGDLPAGDYTVVETDLSADYRSVVDGDSTTPGDDAVNADTNDNMIPVSVDAGESDTGNDFVDEQIPGMISGFVIEDTDGDGEGDMAITGVTINLIGPGPDGDINTTGDNVIVQTTTTSSDFTMPGFYEFTDVTPGDYLIMEVQPDDMVNVKDGDEDDSDPLDTEVNNGSTTDDIIPVSIAAGENDIRNDFVEEASASISGVVTEDLDNDDIGDDPLTGVTITLLDENNVTVGTTTTSDGTTDLDGDGTNEPAGSYYFGDLPAGDYTVVETDLSADYRSVVDGDSTTPGDDAVNADTNDNMIPVSVDAGESDTGNDFVDEQIPGKISGFVIEDTDGDGNGNVGIGNVTIQLIGAGPDGDINTVGDNVIVQTTTTSSDFMMVGFYEFTNVVPGDYIVMEIQPADLASVKDGDEDDSDPLDTEVNNGSTNDDMIPVSITAGENDIRNDFVEEAKQSIMICGNVFYDTDLLEDNMVDGLRLIPGGIQAVLVQVNPDMSEVISAVADVPGFGEPMVGEFCFPGQSSTNYYVILTTSPVVVGSTPPATSTLPTDIFSTGENNGAGLGSDGNVNGTSAEFFTTTVDVSDVNFGIIRFVSITVD